MGLWKTSVLTTSSKVCRFLIIVASSNWRQLFSIRVIYLFEAHIVKDKAPTIKGLAASLGKFYSGAIC